MSAEDAEMEIESIMSRGSDDPSQPVALLFATTGAPAPLRVAILQESTACRACSRPAFPRSSAETIIDSRARRRRAVDRDRRARSRREATCPRRPPRRRLVSRTAPAARENAAGRCSSNAALRPAARNTPLWRRPRRHARKILVSDSARQPGRETEVLSLAEALAVMAGPVPAPPQR